MASYPAWAKGQPPVLPKTEIQLQGLYYKPMNIYSESSNTIHSGSFVTREKERNGAFLKRNATEIRGQGGKKNISE